MKGSNDMKKSLIVVAALAAVLTAGAAFATDGYVNLDGVLANYPAFKQAQQQLQTVAQQKAAAVNAEKDKTKQQQLAQQAQQELVQEEQKLMAPVTQAVRDAIAKVAKEKKLGMVHPAAIVLYGGVDITKEVSDTLNK